MKRPRDEQRLLAPGELPLSDLDVDELELEEPREPCKRFRAAPREPSAWGRAAARHPLICFARDARGQLFQAVRFEGGTLEASRATGIAYYTLHRAARSGTPCSIYLGDHHVVHLQYA